MDRTTTKDNNTQKFSEHTRAAQKQQKEQQSDPHQGSLPHATFSISGGHACDDALLAKHPAYHTVSQTHLSTMQRGCSHSSRPRHRSAATRQRALGQRTPVAHHTVNWAIECVAFRNIHERRARVAAVLRPRAVLGYYVRFNASHTRRRSHLVSDQHLARSVAYSSTARCTAGSPLSELGHSTVHRAWMGVAASRLVQVGTHGAGANCLLSDIAVTHLYTAAARLRACCPRCPACLGWKQTP